MVRRDARVVSIGDYTSEASPYPVERMKRVLRQVRPEEIQKNQLKATVTPEPPRKKQVKRKKKKKNKWIPAIVFFTLGALVVVGILIYGGIITFQTDSDPSPKLTVTATPSSAERSCRKGKKY